MYAQQGVDAEAQRAVERLVVVAHTDGDLQKGRLVRPDDVLQDAAQRPAAVRGGQVAAGEIRDAVVDQRLPQFLEVRRPVPAPPAGVQQVIQVALHGQLQLAQHLAARARRLGGHARLVVEQAVQHRGHERLVGFDTGHGVPPQAGGCSTVRSRSSRIDRASPPTSSMRWPTPRTGAPSPPRQSVRRPRRRPSSVSAAAPAYRVGR